MPIFWDTAYIDEIRQAASLRHPRRVVAAARAGSHIATLPYAVLKAMIEHPMTDVGIDRFLADARRYTEV